MSKNVRKRSYNLNRCIGLVNYGNTCFLNASLQLLMSMTEVARLFILNPDSTIKYTRTFMDYMNTETLMLGPNILYKQYMKLNTRYRGHTQEDSHEFLTYILDNMSESMTGKVKDIFNELVQIDMDQKYGTSITSQKEYILSLGIPSGKRLVQLIQEFLKQKTDGNTDLLLRINKCPKYLVLALKRFSYSSNGGVQKNMQIVDCPLSFKLDSVNYELKSFIVHSGSANSGHYYSFVRRLKSEDSLEHKWICCNDSSVKDVPLSTVHGELCKSYILMYEKSG